jgi:hypothetical protein
MKAQLQHFIVLLAFLTGLSEAAAQPKRFLDETFSSVIITNDIIYGNNYSLLTNTGTPGFIPLLMDVYEPGIINDTIARPLVIVIHTGSFLPAVINGQPTGGRRDSSIVEMCNRFARRGYIVAAMSYRLGWNPQATGSGVSQDIRTGTLLEAVYRAIQDTKACVRYFKADAASANTFKVDTNRIILAGQGTGGYIALAYATLDDPAEIALPKFLSSNTIPQLGYVAGQPYVNQDSLGDFDGYGGSPNLNNPNNNPGHSGTIHFVVNMGGAMGDSSWLEPGDPAIVAFHPVGDPYAPYYIGDVIVPVTGDFVVEVSGSGHVLEVANRLGINYCMDDPSVLADPYTSYANSINGGNEGLYPLYMNPPQQVGPWEWYDSTATVVYAGFLPPPFNTQGGVAYSNALATNPDMSKAKAMAYLDTIMGYAVPRIYRCRGLNVGLSNLDKSTNLLLLPNPADQELTVRVGNGTEMIRQIEIIDYTGRKVAAFEEIDAYEYTLSREMLTAGTYLVKATFDQGEIIRKVIFR